ncbi:MAG: AsmA-like C-terminal region-containing protein [Bacteroidales bacterium]|nr:AsmA family protein [Lentimicrobiaceae bacterium]MDD5694566.1 AsmA-like C-terminal region-containing protein [Bacteroidales bacterium]
MHPIIPRTLKILKRVLIILLIVIGGSLLTGTVLFLIYKDSIQQAIIHEINKNLTAEVRTGKIRISLLAHFPMISVNLKDVRITDPLNRAEGNDLLHTDAFSMRFSIMDVLHKKYNLEIVKMENARINLIVFEDGSDNFHFWKPSSDAEPGNFAIEIREVILRMIDVSWQNRRNGDRYTIRVNESRAKGNISEENFDLTVRGNFLARLIKTNDKIYLRDRELYASVSVNNNDQVLRIREGMIRTGLLTFTTDGTVPMMEGQEMDLNIRMAEAPLKECLSLIPSEYLSWMNKISVDGQVSATMAIKGKMSAGSVPGLQMNFRLAKGKLGPEKSKVRFTDILAEGSYSLHAAKGNNATDELSIDRLQASLGDGRVEGFLRLTQLKHPVVSLKADVDLGLRSLADLLPFDTLQEIKGRLNMQVEMKGPLNSFNKMNAHDLLDWRIQGNADLFADRIIIKMSPLKCRDVRAVFRFDNQLLTIQDLSGKTETSDYQVRGMILNYLPAIFSTGEILKMDLSLNSNQLNMNEFMNRNRNSGTSGYIFSLPSNIILNADVAIQSFLLDDFSASGIQTRLIMRDQRITLNDLTFSSMQGTITAGLDLNPVNDHLYLFRCNVRLNHIDIRQLFHDFRNFGQSDLTDQHLRGYVDADVFYSSKLTRNLTLDAKSIYTLGQITVTSGELIGYAPLYKLAGVLDLDDLKHIRFSELKNLIEIRNSTIIIPEMEIRSNPLELTLYGTHTFSNEIDYHLNLLISQLLSKKVKPDTQREFGVVKDDGLGRTRLYVAMTGTTDHPRFSFDGPAWKEKLAKDLQHERQELKAALQKEFSINRGDAANTEKINYREQPNFRIQWEEDEQDSVPNKKDQKKIKGPKFNIEWENEDTLDLQYPG